MTAGRSGDRVRVVLEGVRDSGSFAFWIGDQNRGAANLINPDAAHVVSIEVLSPPDPDNWPPQQGDVWHLSGTSYFVHNDGWGARFVASASGSIDTKSLSDWMKWALDWREDFPTLGFALIARHGKPVTP